MLAHLSNRKSCWLLLAGVESPFPGAGCLPSLLTQDLGEHSLVLPLLEWQSEFLLETRTKGMVNAKLEVSTSIEALVALQTSKWKKFIYVKPQSAMSPFTGRIAFLNEISNSWFLMLQKPQGMLLLLSKKLPPSCWFQFLALFFLSFNSKLCLCWTLNHILLFWVSLALCLHLKSIIRSALWVFNLIQKSLGKYWKAMKYYIVCLVFCGFFFCHQFKI